MRLVGGTGEGVQVEGGAGARRGPGAKPRRGVPPDCPPPGEPPRLSRNELKMFHGQILSRNEAWFVKIRKEMTTFPRKTKNIFFHFATRWTGCTHARIVSGISPATICCGWFCPPLHLIPVCLNSPFPILTKQLSKILFSKLFKHWTSWSCVPYAMVHRSLLQWMRGERVPLSLYERTSVAVLHFHFMMAFYNCIPQTPGKSRRFLIFPNNHRRQGKVLFFLFLLHGLVFPHFFSTFTTRPSISSIS